MEDVLSDEVTRAVPEGTSICARRSVPRVAVLQGVVRVVQLKPMFSHDGGQHQVLLCFPLVPMTADVDCATLGEARSAPRKQAIHNLWDGCCVIATRTVELHPGERAATGQATRVELTHQYTQRLQDPDVTGRDFSHFSPSFTSDTYVGCHHF